MNQKANKQNVFWIIEGWSVENMDLSISYSDAVSSKKYLI